MATVHFIFSCLLTQTSIQLAESILIKGTLSLFVPSECLIGL